MFLHTQSYANTSIGRVLNSLDCPSPWKIREGLWRRRDIIRTRKFSLFPFRLKWLFNQTFHIPIPSILEIQKFFEPDDNKLDFISRCLEECYPLKTLSFTHLCFSCAVFFILYSSRCNTLTMLIFTSILIFFLFFWFSLSFSLHLFMCPSLPPFISSRIPS